MRFAEDGLGRYRLTLIILMLVACVGYLVVIWASGIETEVMNYRFLNAQEIFSGTIPATEYPPLALVFIAAPMLFADTPWGYNIAFVAEMFVFMVAGLIASSRLASALGRDERRAMLAYTVLTLLMLEFVVDRFDMIPAVMTVSALWLYAAGRREWAFVLLALGTLTKLYPAILFPVLVLHLLLRGERGDALRGTLAFVGTGAAAAALCWAVDPELVTGFLTYQGDRPLQLESVASSVVYLLSMLGLADVRIQSAQEPGSFLSDNLLGPLPDAVAGVLMPVMALAVLSVCALYLWRARRSDADPARLAALAMLGCMMTLIVFNKVFSSQYLIWTIPPVLLVCLVADPPLSRRLSVSVLAMFVLTQLNFAYNIGYLGGGVNVDDLGMMVILARNLVAVYVLWLCVDGVLRPGRAHGPSLTERLRTLARRPA